MSSSSDWLNLNWSSSDQAILEERAQRLQESHRLDFGQLVPSPTHVYLTACGQRLALELARVRAVVPAGPATHLPRHGGLIGYEREVFWVDSLTRLAGLGPATGPPRQVVLLRAVRLGFWVENVDGMEMLNDPPTESVVPIQGSHLAIRRSLAEGRLLLDEP